MIVLPLNIKQYREIRGDKMYLLYTITHSNKIN